jgi:hypothetical protein
MSPAPALSAVGILITVQLAVPRTSSAQADPCDPVPACPCTQACQIEGWGIQLTVHPAEFECFKFCRRLCGQGGWVSVYEGPSNSICDCGYNPSNIYLYKAERYWNYSSGGCDSLYGSCETMLWITGDCEWVQCSP